ncbi:hypothetical protein Ocin01_05310 [Orchesella cincta]|uniref:Uncharacterized protein n=1 Tax=Orchesella cincta TaxID=48709 RepID=A0A1D2N7W7_ORCCI|nr:hypothetical protein Ocin01_05310 [Orchesella cincta]
MSTCPPSVTSKSADTTFVLGKDGIAKSLSWTGRNNHNLNQPGTSTSSSGASTPTDEDESCQVCARPTAPLFCFSCGFFMANGRVFRPCAMHPKVIFYSDFSTCPKCKKKGALSELD